MRERQPKLRWLSLLTACLLFISASIPLVEDASADAAPSVQLVRLSISSEAGMVRVEITADSSLSETIVEQQTRGPETVVRIRGARSLLRPSYTIDNGLAQGVRTVSGEMGGEPFVDILIRVGDGATFAQRKSFNRLVIGIASDFAQLRRKASRPITETEASRAKQQEPRHVSVASAPVTDAIGERAVNSYARVETTPSAPANLSTASPVNVNAPVETHAVVASPIFRGRTIWSDLRPYSSLIKHRVLSAINPSYFDTPGSLNLAAQDEPLSFFPMFLEAPGATPGVWVPGTTTTITEQAGGRAVGPGFLRPLFRFEAAFDDNFFYRSAVGRNIGIFTFAPRLEYEIPGERGALRVAYEARLRRLTNGEWANGHVLDFDTRFNLGPSFRLALRDHFVRSPLDPREYDPAGEVYIVGDTFVRNDVGLRLEYLTSPRGRVALDLGYNLVRWSDEHIASAPLFINYDDFSSAISYERDLSEGTTALASFSFAYADTSVPLRPEFDGQSDRRRFEFALGARHQVTEASGLALRVGFERSLFRDAPSANNFSGLVFDLRFSGELTEKTRFELAALRKTQLSAFNLEGGNARLISTGGAARLEHGPWDALKLGLSLNYQRLGFPLAILGNSTASGGVFVGDFAGERRDEHLYGFGFDATYDVSELLRARLLYNFSRRDSTIPVFTFNGNRVSLVFEFGRRNEVRGRPF